MTTTIKVSNETRDRLKAQAAAAQVPLGEYLTRLADLADRRDRLAAMRRAIDSTGEAELAAYRAEAAEWAQANLVDPPAPASGATK